MKKYRTFSTEFKHGIIAQIDSDTITLAAAAREHNISPSLLDKWRRQIHEGTLRDTPTANEKQLEKELDKYKKKVGELALEVDLLKKLNSDLAHTKKWNGFVVTKKQSNPSCRDAK